MSLHKSLVAKGRLKRHRNVLSRVERIAKLEEEERWAREKNSVFSLPKVRVQRLKRAHVKKKEEATEEGAAATGAAGAAAPAAAPAAGAAAKPAKGASKK